MKREYGSYEEYKRRKKRKKKSHGCLLIVFFFLVLFILAIYGLYNVFFKEDNPNPNPDTIPPLKQSSEDMNFRKREDSITKDNKYEKLFGNAKYLIHVHKRTYKLELFKKGNSNPIKTYGIAVAKNNGDKKKSGDNRTPTSWGNAVDIPKSYAGAKYGISSKTVPFRVEEICEASSWTHDFNDGKGVINGAYGPWFISLDTGWDGIGIHGTHDPKSIGTNASEGCIRLNNKDVDELRNIIYSDNKGIGTRVIITED